MRLRRRARTPQHGETPGDASSESTGKRRGRAKRARGQVEEEAWYRSVPPLFDQPVSDEYLGGPDSPVDAPQERGSLTVELPGQSDMVPPWAAAEPPPIPAPDTAPVWEAEAAAAPEAATVPEAASPTV